MMVAANAPDLDTVAWLGGPLTFLRWHRHLTHSLIAIPVMAIVSVVLVRLLGRKPVRWLPAFGAAVAGVISHVLLDLTNVYGVRLQLPFSGEWTHWDTMPVIDAGVWTILLIGLAAPFLNRLLNSELGVRERGAGAGWAILSLVLLVGYEWARRDLHNYVLGQMEARTFAGYAARRVGAFPHQNPLEWDGVAELSYGYAVVPLRVGREMESDDGQIYPKGERTPAMAVATRTEPFQRLQEFVQWPVWSSFSSGEGDSVRVTLMDLRFGRPNDSGFTSTALISKTGEVLDSRFSMGRTRVR